MKLFAVSVVLGAVIALSALSANAAVETTPYVIKQSAPSMGTNVKRPIVVVGTVPLNKRYDELTKEQKDTLKSVYEKIGDSDDPPFPVNGLMSMYKSLADVHEKLELMYKGPVTMYVQVDSEGNPGALYLVEAPDAQIGQAVANILAKQKFKPGMCNGTPCSMKFVFHAELVGPDWQNNGATAITYKVRDQ